jgi:hypothetical protein
VPIVATAISLLDHVPPVIAFDKAEVVPGQTLRVPLIAPGTALTVIGKVVKHPPGSV